MKIILDPKRESHVIVLGSNEMAAIYAALKFTTSIVDDDGQEGSDALYRVYNQFVARFGR